MADRDPNTSSLKPPISDNGQLTTDRGQLTTDNGLMTADNAPLTFSRKLPITEKGALGANDHAQCSGDSGPNLAGRRSRAESFKKGDSEPYNS